MSAERPPQRASLASLQELPEYHIRTGSSGAISQQVEISPAYVIEWNTEVCQRRFLGTIDELHKEIDAGKSDHFERLFVIHGLPVDYVKALRSSLDIDPAFIEAHAGRRRYRPLRWRGEATFAHYEYPELVRGYNAAVAGEVEGGLFAPTLSSIDLLANPVIRSISDCEDTAAVFCHASLWITPRADVLLLDRPIWRDPSSPLRKARRAGSVTKPYQLRPGSSQEKRNSWEVRLAEGDELGSLEDVLQETLKDAKNIGDQLMDIVAELAYDHWLEFFELLTPHQQPVVHDGGSLYWQITQSLEQNFDVAKYIGRQSRQPDHAAAYPDWQALLSRTQRRIGLLPTILPKRPAVFSKRATKAAGSGHKKFSRESTAYGSSRSGAGKQQSSAYGSSESENQRSLDRVSYLGGILLPFSVVSGILSMDDDFAPGAQLFWVFWVVAIPLALITILIIYADGLRKAEVWVEVATEGVVAGLAPQAKPTPEEDDKGKRPSSQESQPPPPQNGRVWPQPRIAAAPGDIRRPITYSAGDDVVLDIPEAPDDEQAEIQEAVEEDVLETPEEPTMILERPTDGSRPRAWKKQQLGWYGACRSILGFKKPRRAADIPLGVVAYDRRPVRRTKSWMY